MTWIILLAIPVCVLSLWLMVEGAEKFTDGLLSTAIGFGLSAFALGYIFGGIDLENLAVGIAGAAEGSSGISMGTVIGSAVFLLTFAVGVTALVSPLPVRVPRRLIILTLLSPLPLALLGLDGDLSRLDGAILFGLSLLLIGYVLRTSRHAALYQPKEIEAAEGLDAEDSKWCWGLPLLMAAGAGAIVIGAVLFSWSVRHILSGLGWDDTLFGMLVVAAAVSFEEVPRMVIPAKRGHAEISIGNIIGTVMFFVLFNAGVIAIIHPLALDSSVLGFYWPALMIALGLMSVLLWRERIGRGAGMLLLSAYVAYVGLAVWGGYALPV